MAIVAFFVVVYCVKVPNAVLPSIQEFLESENVVVNVADVVDKNKSRPTTLKRIKAKETNLKKKKQQ